MAYLSAAQLTAMGFKSLGCHVKISDRAAIHQPELIELGDHARIDDFCVVSGRVSLGRYCFVGTHSNIAGGRTGVFLADFASVAYGVHIFAQTDDYLGRGMVGPEVPVAYRREKCAAVYLESHVAVGAGSYVLPGVTLAEGSAIGAMSLVTHSTEPWSVSVGVPAKRRGSRSRDVEALAQAFLAGEPPPIVG